MSQSAMPFVLPPGEGDLLTFQGVSTRLKVRAEQTNGAWSLIESAIDPRFDGFKVHVHERIVETFYVLEGTLTFRLDDRVVQAPPGTLIQITPGVWHTYWNATDAPARYLLHIAPGGFEIFLKALAEMVYNQAHGVAVDMRQLQELAARYDATI